MNEHETSRAEGPGALRSRMAGDAAALLARIEPATGRLLNPGGTYALADQHAIYALAHLYRHPGTAWQGRKDLLLATRGMGDAIAAVQKADGRFPLIAADGTFWGNSTLPWHVGPWLEAERLLGDALEPASRACWREGLDPHSSGDFGLTHSTGQQAHAFPPARLHTREVPACLRSTVHGRRISSVTHLCKSQ